ncbi:hypothetical protein CTI12_AA112520 [Artemisia annua]|uniref:Reverse transcriptase domain-containing protein n=1 Tax=Artemisia annua TaxID=35608 RepID=A0A2U1PU80_ARTAN|nr:hypothetical protein CTI12_AA112520 [Artemisia annua]
MIASYKENIIYVDRGRSIDIMYKSCFNKLPENIRHDLRPPTTPLIGFSGGRSYPEDVISLEFTVKTYPLSKSIMMDFHIVKSTLKYNVLMGRSTLQKLSIGVSTIRSLAEFPTMVG